jgi:hypothetical protein
MTYACTLSNNGGSISVDFDKTYAEGGGPQYSYVNEVAVLEVPADSSGNTQAQAMDLKYTQESVTIQGSFMDGLGTADWNTPGSTKFEKLLALAKLEIVPLVLAWPVATKTWYCIVTRLTVGEQGGHGNTVSYDIALRIVGSA